MAKKKRAVQKWVADPSQSQKDMPLTISQIEDRLTKVVLGGTLALHLLRSRKKPANELLNELFDIEFQVGQFVGAALQSQAHTHGTLAGALSFIPIGSQEPKLRAVSELSLHVSSNRRNKKPRKQARL